MTAFHTFYVDEKNGDDTCSGTSAVRDTRGVGPFRTLSRAVLACREQRNGGSLAPLTVALCSDVTLTETLAVSGASEGAESGSPLSDVTFVCEGGRHRVLGGMRLCAWERDTIGGYPCYSAAVPEGTYFEDLYVGGAPARRSRFPEEGRTLTARETEHDGVVDPTYHCTWFIAHPEDLACVPDVCGATVNFAHYWIDEHSPVASFDRESGKITMALCSRMQINTLYAKDGKPEDYAAFHYWLENVRCGCSHPGDWYLDKEMQRVFYIPKDTDPDVASFEAYIPRIGKLIDVRGTADHPIRGIRFSGIDFFCSRGEYASTLSLSHDAPDAPLAADAQSACNAPGAVEFSYGIGCEMSDCSFLCVGAYALRIGSGCRHVRVDSCRFSHVSAGGVLIGGGARADRPAELTGDVSVLGCTFCHLGERYAAGCAILSKDAADCDYSYNDIADVRYSGISVGWVWGFDPSVSHHNRVSHNRIRRVGGDLLSDMGGIYTLGVQPGTVISDNVIHDVSSSHYGGWGIYLDEGSSGILVERNHVWGTGSAAICQHYGRDNLIRSNVFAAGARWVDFGKNMEINDISFEGNLFLAPALPARPEELTEALPPRFFGKNAFLCTTDAPLPSPDGYGGSVLLSCPGLPVGEMPDPGREVCAAVGFVPFADTAGTREGER